MKTIRKIGKVVPIIDESLYERCINLAMRMLEKETRFVSGMNYFSSVERTEVISKYKEDEIFKLADKLYAKIKGAK